jgi:hypothetical protein
MDSVNNFPAYAQAYLKLQPDASEDTIFSQFMADSELESHRMQLRMKELEKAVSASQIATPTIGRSTKSKIMWLRSFVSRSFVVCV